jgi:hypothetical protein
LAANSLALRRPVLDEILEERTVSDRGRQVPRGVKRKMSNYLLRPPRTTADNPDRFRQRHPHRKVNSI